VERSKLVKGRFTSDIVKRTIRIDFRFNGSAGDQMGWRWHQTSRGMILVACLHVQ
jgi:hypothetical protein